jgi:hypothetical protein
MRVPGTTFSLNPGSFAVGVAAAFVAPIVLPVITSALKSVTKAGIKTGLIVYGKSKELVGSTTAFFVSLSGEAMSEAETEIKAKKSKADKSNE